MSEPLTPEIVTGKAKGGIARAQKLTPGQRSEIARKGALAKWGQDGSMPEAVCEGVLPFGAIDLECYVLKDRRRVFHKRGMAKSLGMKSAGGNVFLRAMNSKGLGSVIPAEVWEKLHNPIIFKTLTLDLGHGYDATILIDATLKAAAPPLALPKREFMERAREIWEELGRDGLVFRQPQRLRHR